MSTALPLNVKLELRAITNNNLNRDSAVMISSTIPSAKYYCSGSPLMFWKGSTAIEGLSGRGGSWSGIGEAFGAGVEASLLHDWPLHARMGSAMFFKACGPI